MPRVLVAPVTNKDSKLPFVRCHFRSSQNKKTIVWGLQHVRYEYVFQRKDSGMAAAYAARVDEQKILCDYRSRGGCSLVVEHDIANVKAGVRFSIPAPEFVCVRADARVSCGCAPVVKWISHQSSELTFQVRILAGAIRITCGLQYRNGVRKTGRPQRSS